LCYKKDVMARHAAPNPIAPETALLPVVTDRRPDSMHVLGGSVVHAANFANQAADNAAYFNATGTYEQALEAQEQAEQAQERTERMLDTVRGRITNAPDDPHTDEYLYRAFGGMFDHARRQGAPHTTVRDWLVDKEHGATNRQLHSFVVTHVEHIARRRESPETLAMVERAKARYIDGVEQAIDMGLYVPEARDSLQRIRNAHVVVGDYWDYGIMRGALAYRTQGTDYVVLGQRLDDRPEGMALAEETLVHEYDHLQFSDSMIEQNMPSTFREAMAEHTKESILRGYWHVINPHLRPTAPFTYTDDLVLMDSLLNDGAQRVDPILAIRAHSAPAGHTAWNEYLRAVHKAWGFDVHNWAQDTIDRYQEGLIQDGVHPIEARQAAFNHVRSEMYHSDHGKKIAHALGANAIKNRRHGRRRR
jgi:hypothetical protein